MSYHREYRASRVRYHEHVHVPIVGPVTMHMTGSEFENLIAHSGYYRRFARNDAIPNQSVMSITVKNIEQIDHGLSLHVIALNCRAVPVLPDFRFVNIRHFIRICLFYDLHVMLDQMINFTLDTGLHYFPQFFRYLCGILSPQNTLAHCLVTGFLTLWNANQLDYLEYYFPAHSEIGPISPTQWAKILYNHFRILPGLARSLIQSPPIRVRRQNHMGKQVSPVFPVCPSCERDIPNPNEGGFTLTNCCREIIHMTCLATYDTCHICRHENNALAKYSSIGFSVDISTQSILRERKYIHWQPGCIYQVSAGGQCYPNSCWSYDRSHAHWHIYPHFIQKELAKTYFLSPQDFVEWFIANLFEPNEETCKMMCGTDHYWHL